jgi:hypothetical protein
MLRPNSGHRQVYNSSAVRVLQYASLRQGVDLGVWITFILHIIFLKVYGF